VSAPWDRLSVRYGAQERLETRAVDTALRLASSPPAERLVDLATGTGLVLRRLAACPARPLTAIGVDRSAGMLARAGELPPGWSTMHAEARQVPLPSAWADVVTCSYLLHLLEPAERAEVLAEARRLLRPTAPARLITVTVWADDRRGRGRLVSRALSLAARARPATWGGLRPLDPSRDLTAAGFVVTRRVVLPRRGYPSLVLAARPRSCAQG
jgi:ubiquinone/menaquinone biosynthesis C-methylase UbiE